jgi:hypothetical protein
MIFFFNRVCRSVYHSWGALVSLKSGNLGFFLRLLSFLLLWTLAATTPNLADDDDDKSRNLEKSFGPDVETEINFPVDTASVDDLSGIGFNYELHLAESESREAPYKLPSIIPDTTAWNLSQFVGNQLSLDSNRAETIAGEITELFHQMRDHGKSLENHHSPREFSHLLDSGKVKMRHENGNTKVTFVDGVKWTKVIHSSSPIAYLFFNEDKVSPSSKHVDLIRANIHFNAGKSMKPEDMPNEKMAKARRKGALFGRDLAIVWYREDGNATKVSRVEYFARPEKGTPTYDYEFKLACDKPFRWGNFIWNGGVLGLLQIGILSGLNLASPHIPFLGGEMPPLHPALYVFTVAYSMYAGGIVYPKLRARTQRMTYNSRFWIRGLTVSLPYAIVYKAFVTFPEMQSAWAAAGYLPLATYFARQAVNISINFILNNRVSNALIEHTQLDQELRVHLGEINWLKKFGLSVRKVDYKGQERYLLVSFSSRTIDLNDNFRGISIPLPLLDDSYFLSTAKALYLGVAPAVRYSVVRRAEKADSSLAPSYREAWNRSLSGRMVNGGKALARRVSTSCKSLVRATGL